MSRSRKQESGGEKVQYWHSAVNGIKSLPNPQDISMPQRFSHLMKEAGSDEAVPRQVRDDAIAKLELDEQATYNEIETLQKVAESLNILIALQSHVSPPPSASHTPAASAALLAGSSSTPVPTPATALPSRLKVSLNSSSTPSHHHAQSASPAASTSRQASLTRSSPAPAQYGTPGSSKDTPSTTKKGRGPGKANMLEKDRRVAYEDEPGTWLLFRVVSGGKEGKGKDAAYVIQDIDSTDKLYIPPIQTTYRRLIPLPDISAPISHPSHPSNYPTHAKGADVLAAYPETTSLYPAVVLGREKSKRPEGGRYIVAFEEDDLPQRFVDSWDVVAAPGRK